MSSASSGGGGGGGGRGGLQQQQQQQQQGHHPQDGRHRRPQPSALPPGEDPRYQRGSHKSPSRPSGSAGGAGGGHPQQAYYDSKGGYYQQPQQHQQHGGGGGGGGGVRPKVPQQGGGYPAAPTAPSTGQLRSGHIEVDTLYGAGGGGQLSVNSMNAPNNSTMQCGCENIDCPFCNLMLSVQMKDSY